MATRKIYRLREDADRMRAEEVDWESAKAAFVAVGLEAYPKISYTCYGAILTIFILIARHGKYEVRLNCFPSYLESAVENVHKIKKSLELKLYNEVMGDVAVAHGQGQVVGTKPIDNLKKGVLENLKSIFGFCIKIFLMRGYKS